MRRSISVILIYCFLFTFMWEVKTNSFIFNDGAADSEWISDGNWDSSGFPGQVAAREDDGTIIGAKDVVVTDITGILNTPDFTVGNLGSLEFNAVGLSFGAGSVAGDLRVLESATVESLSVAGLASPSLTISAGKQLTSTGTVSLGGSFVSSGTLSGTTITLDLAHTLTSNLIGNVDVTAANGDITMTGGSISGGTLDIAGSFGYSGGSIDGIDIDVSGSITLGASVTSTLKTLTTGSSSTFTIDSSSSAVTLDFSDYQFSSGLTFDCQNDINLLGSITILDSVGVTGASDCTVSLPVEVDIDQAVTVTDATLSLGNPIDGDTVIDSDVLVDGSGVLELNGQTLIANGELKFQGSSQLKDSTPQAVKLSQETILSSFIFEGSQSLLSIEYIPAATPRGTLTINSPTSNVEFTGATSISQGGQWTFTDCQKVTLNQQIAISKTTTVKCPLDIKQSTTLSSTLSIEDTSLKIYSGTSFTQSSGQFKADSTSIVTLAGTVSFNTGLSLTDSTLNIEGGSTSITSSSLTLQGTQISLTGGTFDLSGATDFSLEDGGLLNILGGTLNTGSGNTFNFRTNSNFTYDVTGQTFNGMIVLEGSIFHLMESVTFGTGSLTGTTSSTLEIDQSQTFPTTFDVDLTDSVINHNIGTLIIGSSFSLTDSQMTSASGTTLTIDGDINGFGTTTSITTQDSLIINGDVSLNLEAKWTQTGTTTINGNIVISDPNSEFQSTSNTILSSSANLTATTNGFLSIKNPVITGTPSFIGTDSGHLQISGTLAGSESVQGDILIDTSGMVTLNSIDFGSATPLNIDLDGGNLRILGTCDSVNVNFISTSSSTIQLDGYLHWTSGTLTIDSYMQVSGSGGLYVDGGNVVLDNSSIRLNGGLTVFEDSVGGFSSSGSSTLKVNQGTVTLANPTIYTESLTVDFSGSTLSYPSIELRDNCRMEFRAHSTIMPSPVTFNDTSFYISESGTTVTFEDDLILYSSYSTVNNDANLIIDTDVIFSQSVVNLYADSLLVLNSGDFDMDSGCRMSFYNSDLQVKNGSMDIPANSRLAFFDGATVSQAGGDTGIIYMRNGSYLEIETGTSINYGILPFVLEANVIIVNSDSSPAGGVTEVFSGPYCQNYTSEEKRYEDSTVTVDTDGCLRFYSSSTFELQSSDLLLRDNGRIEFYNSDFDMSGSDGSFEARDKSKMYFDDAYIYFNSPTTISHTYDAAITNLEAHNSYTVLFNQITIGGGTVAKWVGDDISNSQIFATSSVTMGGDAKIELEKTNFFVFEFFIFFCWFGCSTPPIELNVQCELTATDSVLYIGTEFNAGDDAVIVFKNSNISTSNSGVVTIESAADLTLEQSSNFLIADRLYMYDAADLFVDNSNLALNTSASVYMQTTSSINLRNDGNMYINGPLRMYDDTNTIVSTDSSFVLFGSAANIYMYTDSKFLVKNTGSILSISPGNLNLYTRAEVNAEDYGQIYLANGNIFMRNNAIVNLNTSSILTVLEQGSVNVDDFAKFKLSSSAYATMNGTADFIDLSSFEISTSARAVIYGNLTLMDQGKVILTNSGNLDIEDDSNILGSVRLFDFSKISNTDSNLRVRGALLLSNNSNIDGTRGTFKIQKEEILCTSKSKITLNDFSDLEIDGGALNVFDNSTISLTQSDITILNNNMELDDSASLSLKVASTILVSGGDAYFKGNTDSGLESSSEIEVNLGTVYCEDLAEISLKSSSIFNISSSDGFGIFSDNCTITGTSNSKYSSQGNTFFSGFSTVSLSNAIFEVVGGDSHFNDSSSGIFNSGANFQILNGNVYFDDLSTIDIRVFSSFDVFGGSAYQSGNSSVLLPVSGNLNISAQYIHNEFAEINLDSGSTLTVGGSLESSNYARLYGLGASFVTLTTSATVDISDYAIWEINSSTFSLTGGGGQLTISGEGELLGNNNADFSLNGNVDLLNSSKLSLNSSVLIINDGDFTASNSSYVDIINGSVFSLSDGIVTFEDNVDLYVDGISEFNVQNGQAFFEDYSYFYTEHGTFIDIVNGNITFRGFNCMLFDQVDVDVAGNLIMELTACLTYQNSTVTVESGNLIANDDFNIEFIDTPIDIDVGDVIFDGSLISEVHFNNLPIDLLEGQVQFSGSTTSSFIDTILTVTNGGTDFKGFTNTTWYNCSIIIEDIEDNPFVIFQESAITSFTDFELTITGNGQVSFLNSSQSTWKNATVDLLDANLNFIGDGIHNFMDSLLNITGSGDVHIGGSLIGIFDNTDIAVTSENSIIEFYGSINLSFSDMLFNIVGGSVYVNELANLDFMNSNFQIANGAFELSGNSTYNLVNTPLTILASSTGSMIVSEYSYLTLGNSPITMNSGDISFGDHSTLEFTDSGTTLYMEFGNFDFDDHSNFITVQGTQIEIFSGFFRMLGYVDFYFDQVSMKVGGAVLLSDYSKLLSLDSNFNVTGTFNIEVESNFTSISSTIDIIDGFLGTHNSSSFQTYESFINVIGDVIFRGTPLSNHYIESSTLTIYDNGDLEIREFVTAQFVDSCVIILGGFFDTYDYSETRFDGGCMTLEGNGTLIMQDNSNLVITNSALVEVTTSGATASFSDNAEVNVYTSSTLNITDGSVTFSDNSEFNLWEATYFNLLSGSLTLENESSMVAYPFTEGTIVGGNLHVVDNASVVFIQSNIHIVGAIDSNSTNPVQFLNNSVITVDGADVQISGTGVLHISGGTFLHVLDGSIILYDYSQIIADEGIILVSGGSILGYDFSQIYADNSTLITVEGGNITVTNDSTLTATGQSHVIVTTTNTTEGAVYAQGSSNVYISEYSILEVIEGNLEISDFAVVTNTDNSLIRVIDGDIEFFDYSTFIAEPTSQVEVLEGGNFYTEGITTFLSFTSASTRIVSGDFITALRTSLYSSDSSFEISDSGNVRFTDITRTIMEDNTQLQIFGGGNLELLRSAYFILDSSSNAVVGNGGSAIFGEDVIFDLRDSSSLTVDEGNIIFYGDASLNADLNAIGEVTGGGNIEFYDNAIASLDNNSQLSVYDFGSITFVENSFATLNGESYLYVQDGGNIEFSDNSVLNSDNSFLIVLGGGSIILSGDGTNSILNESSFVVDGGNIEYHDNKIIFFESSTFNINSGDFLTYDNAIFEMTAQSSGSVTGGNFILRDSSYVNMIEEAMITISGGNVEMYDFGKITMENSYINVSGTDSSSGSFLLRNSVSISLDSSSISVTGGDFESLDSVVATSNESTISVSSGSLTFDDFTSYTGISSSVSVSGGNLNLQGQTEWSMTTSTAIVSGGNLNLFDDSTTSLDLSTFDVTGGNINILSNADLSISISTLRVSGGDINHGGESTFDAISSEITITSGKIVYEDFSVVSIFNTAILINNEILQFKKDADPIEIGDLMIFGDNAYGHIFGASTLDLTEGNFVLVDTSSALIEDTIITINGGNLENKENASLVFNRVSISLIDGSLRAIDSSNIEFNDNTNVSINGGLLSVEDNVIFDVNDSSFDLFDGSALFTGGETTFTSSSISVYEEGSIQFSGDATLSTIESRLYLTGNGRIEFGGNSDIDFTSSSIDINGGEFYTTSFSSIVFESSNYNINGGNTYFSDNSNVIVSNSNMFVNAGNVYFSDSASVIIELNSIYSVLGGNVYTDGLSSLSIDGSCFVIDEGNVTYSGNSIIELNSSCWNITGGNSIFTDFVTYSLNEKSLLYIETGSFLAYDSVSIEIDSSKTHIIGGNFESNGQTSLILRNNGEIEVEQGNALFNGNTIARITDSFFYVSGGYVEFDGNSDLEWTNSLLSVSRGDMRIKGISNSIFDSTQIDISGGSLHFLGESTVSFENSDITMSLGSVSFQGESIVDLIDSTLSITNGDLQFAEDSVVNFLRSPVTLSGQLEFIGNTETTFRDSNLDIIGGSFHTKDQTNLKFYTSIINIGGSMHAQNDADILIEDCRITIDNGDLQILDRGTFSLHRSSLKILNGDFIAMNPSAERKYISISSSAITVESSESSGNGNFKLQENIELSMTTSDIIIDGSLIMEGSSRINLYDESSFIIPNGVVKMDINSDVILDTTSSLLNQGQLFAPGEIIAPSGSSVSNEGLLESNHDLLVNCNANDITPLMNSGTFSLSPDNNNNIIQSCINDLRHSGLMQFSLSNVTLQQVDTTSDSVFTLEESSIIIEQDSFDSNGSVGGNGNFVGSFTNSNSGIIMANGETSPSRISIENNFSSSGTMFFMINSRDLSDPNAITQISAGGDVSLSGGRACVCFNPSLVLEEGDRFDLLTAQTLLQGRFDQVQFDCSECPVRNAKSIAKSTEADDECEPTADYGAVSFSVLFESCDGGSGNYLDSISPPWYVIFPVAVVIILLVIVFFGGALLLEQKFRRKSIERKSKKKRQIRMQQMVDSVTNTSSRSSTTL